MHRFPINKRWGISCPTRTVSVPASAAVLTATHNRRRRDNCIAGRHCIRGNLMLSFVQRQITAFVGVGQPGADSRRPDETVMEPITHWAGSFLSRSKARLDTAMVRGGLSDGSRTGVGAPRISASDPSHTAGHAGPHPAVREIEVTCRAGVNPTRQTSASTAPDEVPSPSSSTSSRYEQPLGPPGGSDSSNPPDTTGALPLLEPGSVHRCDGSSAAPAPSSHQGLFQQAHHLLARPDQHRLLSGFCSSARRNVPRLLQTVGRPSAFALLFLRRDLLREGLTSPSLCQCRAHKKKRGHICDRVC